MRSQYYTVNPSSLYFDDKMILQFSPMLFFCASINRPFVGLGGVFDLRICQIFK